MRISEWSSDVCSSDLSGIAFEHRRAIRRRTRHEERGMARVAIVTGGTRGIGEAISLALKEAGMTVAAHYAGNAERATAFTDRTGHKASKWDVGDFDRDQKGWNQGIGGTIWRQRRKQ